MSTITLRLPEEVLKTVRRRAEAEGHTVDEELRRCIEHGLARREWAKQQIQWIEEFHRQHRIPPLDEELLRRAVEEGRP